MHWLITNHNTNTKNPQTTKTCNDKVNLKIATVLKLLSNDSNAAMIMEKTVANMNVVQQKRIKEVLAIQIN